MQRGELCIRGSESSQGLGQLVLALANPPAQVANGAGRVLLWSKLVHVDLALAPIYFLAQLLYLPHAIAASAGGRRQGLSMKGNQICQTA